mmetsp:Transcript_9006/g.19992  ORF Transcript_9006/g.19992 Transcript_9006/m.19992 type:complete len:624 (-) Transcript_9006:223-2094(-)
MAGPRPPQSRRFADQALTVEDQIRASYYVPDPTTYHPTNTHSQHLEEPKVGGLISNSQHPSPLVYVAKAKAYVPGPGSYIGERDFILPEGGRVNRNPPRDYTKPFDDYPRPDPGTYGIPNDPARPRQVSGQFSKDARVSKYIMDEVRRTKLLPGPGEHEVAESYESMKPFCPEGGRCLNGGKIPNYFEAASKTTQGNPEPGAYALPSSLNGNKAQGQLVYRYESATSAETKALVAKMTGKGEGPGPGAYNLPDPPNIHPTPTIRGRQTAALPSPFAYNCRPDYCGRFTVSTGVLHKNSADQIFGTGITKGGTLMLGGNSNKGGDKDSRPASGDQLKDREVPFGLLAAEQPDVEVEWKAGGFSSLKKSRSAPTVRAEHPMVVETARCYPKLQRKLRDRSVILPCSSRRTEVVKTHESSSENTSLQNGKWRLGKLAIGLEKMTSAALEPLDEDKLKKNAMKMLEEKAKNRMRLEGVNRVQQQLILEEMRGFMRSTIKAPAEPGSDGEQQPQISQHDAAQASFEEMPPSGQQQQQDPNRSRSAGFTDDRSSPVRIQHGGSTDGFTNMVVAESAVFGTMEEVVNTTATGGGEGEGEGEDSSASQGAEGQQTLPAERLGSSPGSTSKG